MGTRGREIVGENVDQVLDLLSRAYADEWLAYYQYWIGAKVASGPMKEAVMAELLEHANDELRHAGLVADRMLQLGGTPALEPKQWYGLTNCGYEAPEDPYVKVLVEQNIKAEQCAISVYNDMLKVTRDIDPVTYNIALGILEDEIEHEEDLQDLEEDLKDLVARRD